MDSLVDEIAHALQIAVDHHRAGRMIEASACYQQILDRKPDHDNALHLLGVIAAQTGQPGNAVELIRRAIAINPDAAEYHANLGKALRAGGRVDEAIAAFRQAVRLGPDIPDYHATLAQTLMRCGMLDESVAEYRRAMVLNPDSMEARDQLLAAFNEAIAAHRKALALQPEDADRYAALALVYRDNGQLDDAIDCLNQAIRLKPGRAVFHSELGVVLDLKGCWDEAIAACRRAIQLDPKDASAYCNLGHALVESGRYDQAIVGYQRAVQLAPHWPAAHLNLGLALLTRSDFQHGWPEYAWRWRVEGAPPLHAGVSQPMWDGSAFAGKTLLLRPEQGLGDTIQFIRYLPMVLARGGRVIFACQPALARLLQQLPGLELATSQPLPPFDLHCTLLHLPQLLDTRLETIPGAAAYLNADRALAKAWADKIGTTSRRLRIGLVWAGNPTLKDDRRRSISLAQLAPLARSGSATFFSLQKGPAASQAAHPPPGMQLVDLTADLHDFADTAALISHLDLVIAVDTAVAHLAGAMGKPTWLLLPYKPDWRWMLNRQDSPWYPTLRLFRQKSPGDWAAVIERVGQALAGMVS